MSNLRQKENRLKNQVRPWVGKFARFGLTVKGLLYACVGFLALKFALGFGGDTANPKQTISEISKQPLGDVHLVIIALGLMSYAIWRWVDGIANVENHKHDLMGWGKRLFCFLSGMLYGALAVWTVMFVFGQSSSSDESSGSYIMDYQWGRLLIGMIGFYYVGLGLEHFREVIMKDYKKEVDDYKIDRDKKNVALTIAAVGLSARGIIFLIIGWFICKAAIYYEKSEYIGLKGALDKLLEHRHGRWLLGIVAIGFVAYGVYCFFKARYHQFKTRK